MQLKARVNRLEASAPIPEHERITEVHHHIMAGPCEALPC
jgi:hypothetical protein